MAFFKYGDKKIYYDEIGAGLPVVFLHGDTASSKMFEYIIPLYANSFRVILLDFLGNGQSDSRGISVGFMAFTGSTGDSVFGIFRLWKSEFDRHKRRSMGCC